MKINKYLLIFTIFSIILITFIIYNTLCSKKNIEPYSNISSTPTLLTDDKYYTSTPDLWDKNKTKPLIGGQKEMVLLRGSTFILVIPGLWIGNLLKYNYLIVKLKRF